MLLKLPPLSSGGLILSYQCSNQCQHCLYASSPSWKEWMSETQIEKVLNEIKNHHQYLTGIHMAGGEPFLKPKLLEFAVKKACELGVPIDYVETNGFWCWNDTKTEKVYQNLRHAGLQAVLVSCSPFHLEFVPIERTIRAVKIGKQVFGQQSVYIYTNFFYQQLKSIDPQYTLPLSDYMTTVGHENASLAFASEYSLIPNGRAAIKLQDLYAHRPAKDYFGEDCKQELTSPHHIHIDLYGHYIAGLCAGITLGNGFDLYTLYSGIDLETKPILKRLVEGGVEALYHWATETYDYKEKNSGYIAKCHFCLDIRQHLVQTGNRFSELSPKSFYENLE